MIEGVNIEYGKIENCKFDTKLTSKIWRRVISKKNDGKIDDIIFEVDIPVFDITYFPPSNLCLFINVNLYLKFLMAVSLQVTYQDETLLLLCYLFTIFIEAKPHPNQARYHLDLP